MVTLWDPGWYVGQILGSRSIAPSRKVYGGVPPVTVVNIPVLSSLHFYCLPLQMQWD